ncbi:uncharacterized protein LOC129306001 [Prosopis cineraria]|uniref:uncharacterized protein LOC129306001 n=1 Tax=Prosopis cineraria TaxID=364024 RepID=UPI00241018E2|nr:uncharacterized protein LOC129306001 [Prosopis cineraria]XP_054802268.1 uncharacterized protein LOC129306001 [Prosopis cineraria]XP_054802276.1 uncharacterized protein LOC129306001 [Prosopis cineraria]
MDGGEGWRSVRCAGSVQDKTMINRLMLRFRPIAPKPEVGGPLLGPSPTFRDIAVVPARRTKRKYVRVRRSGKESKNGRERSVAQLEELKSRSETTLQLLQENRAEQRVSSKGGAWDSASMYECQEDGGPFIRLNLNLNLNLMNDREEALGEIAVMSPRRKEAETWVTVDYVSETCMDALGLGRTDMENLTNLGGDTCPGFVSDRLNRVVWVNRAFRKMVMGLNHHEDEEPPEMEVRLVMRERLAYSAFTCQLKVQYTWWKGKFSQMVPCDAWRMDCGGFAWRLDVKAALKLGR